MEKRPVPYEPDYSFMLYIVLGVIAAVVVLWLWLGARRKKIRAEELIIRKQRLVKKYGLEVGIRLSNGEIAQGMTEEMVVDALGKPADIDEKVLKTKTKKTLKYNQLTQRSFGTKIFIEDSVVTGWDIK